RLPSRRRLLSERRAGPAGARGEPERPELERALSEEERGPARSLGRALQVRLLPGPARRLRPMVGGRRQGARRRGRERRRHVMAGPEIAKGTAVSARGRHARAARGFTLLELIVTLMILMIVAAISVPVVGRSSDAVRSRAEVAGFSAVLRSARVRALTVRFEPQGTSSGADYKVRAGDVVYRVTVDPITGRVKNTTL